MSSDTVTLPAWARVTERRRAHIARVTALIDRWAAAMRLEPESAKRWHDAAQWHDALRDADEAELRELVGNPTMPAALLHGPAAAVRLAADGERRGDVLEAIRFHTIGSASWGATGRALYMADYLEPGRKFLAEERARIAARVPIEFDAAFDDVVRHRTAWAKREGRVIFAETEALWTAVESGRLPPSEMTRGT